MLLVHILDKPNLEVGVFSSVLEESEDGRASVWSRKHGVCSWDSFLNHACKFLTSSRVADSRCCCPVTAAGYWWRFLYLPRRELAQFYLDSSWSECSVNSLCVLLSSFPLWLWGHWVRSAEGRMVKTLGCPFPIAMVWLYPFRIMSSPLHGKCLPTPEAATAAEVMPHSATPSLILKWEI